MWRFYRWLTYSRPPQQWITLNANVILLYVVQAMVNHNNICLEIIICVGWPVSVHNAKIIANSLLYCQV